MIVSSDVMISWHNLTKGYYTSLGYEFTKKGDKFLIKSYHLFPKSSFMVECVCENCYEVRDSIRSAYNKFCRKCIIKLSPKFQEMLKRNFGRRGKEHPNWNPNLTDDERNSTRIYQPDNWEWRKSVWKRDNYTCRICNYRNGRKNVVAHHLYSYATNKSLRHEISNGVVLCSPCHKEFHQKYGYKNNNPYQYLEFKLIKNNKLNNFNLKIVGDLESMNREIQYRQGNC